MAFETYKLEVHKRSAMTKGELKHMRKEGKIPGIYYSHESKNSTPFYIEKSEIHNIKKSGARLLKISVGGKLKTVFFKSVQYHPVTDEIIHLDLYGVKMDEKIQITVPVNTVGEPIGVKSEGGQLTQPQQAVEVLCLPSNIPEFLELDISELHMNDSIHVRDIPLPEEVEMVTSPDAVVALISHGVREEETVTTEAEEEELIFEEGSEEAAGSESEE